MKPKIAGCLAVTLIAVGAVIVVTVRNLKKLGGIIESMTYDRDDFGEGL